MTNETMAATRVAQARLHRARKDAGVTDLQATTLANLLDGAEKGIVKTVEENGVATFPKPGAEAIVRETKGLDGDAELDGAERMLVTAVVAAIATEFRAAGYAVYGAAGNDHGITVSLI